MIKARTAMLLCAASLSVSMALIGHAKPEPVPVPVPVRFIPQPLPVLQMSSPRAVHAAVTLADGRVALIGGCVADGCEEGPASRTVEIYNPKTHRLSPGGTLTTARIGPAAIALADGRVLIAGGWSGGQTIAMVELYDPTRRTSAAAGNLRRDRADIAAVTLRDGRVALIGGISGRTAVADVDLFDPRTGSITAGPPLVRARATAAAVRLRDGRILVVGGAEGSGDMQPSSSVEIADAALTAWSRAGSLTAARYKHAAVALADGRALVIGGSDARDRQGKISNIEVFDPVSATFRQAGATVTPRFKIAGAVALMADGRVFTGGGGDRAEVFDPRTLRSTLVGPSLGAVRSFATVSVLADGRALIAGGYEENSIAVSRGVWVMKLH